jgi:hypothetical protein
MFNTEWSQGNEDDNWEMYVCILSSVAELAVSISHR